MKISEGLQEAGIPVGNTYDKYGSRNPVVRLLMAGFNGALNDLVARVQPQSIHEVGCGEGYWTLKWLSQGIQARGSDFSGAIIDIARSNAVDRSHRPDAFKQKSVYDLNPADDSANLIVCCEVLEHLEDPRKALAMLAQLAKPYVVLSVPREPIWSVLNVARGKYWSDWGNTPGHINQWSKRQFLALVEEHFDILEIRTPLPWTMILGKVRGQPS